MTGTNLELRHIRSFIVLANELHFTRAAAALNVAQPALSQQIRSLEGKLGFRLFHRTSRKVELTPAGLTFLYYARGLFVDLERAVRNGQHLESGRLGTITVAYTATAMLTVLPAIVRRFSSRHPETRIQLHELSSADQIARLRESKLDVAFVAGKPASKDVGSLEVWRDILHAIVPTTHPAAAKRAVAVSTLADDPFVMFPRGQAPHIHDRICSLCRASGFDPRIEQEAQSWHMIAELVGAGMGVSIVPSCVRRYRVPRVRYVPLRPAESLAVNMCWMRTNQNPLIPQFAEITRDLI